SSFTTPTRVYELDLATAEQNLRKEHHALPGPDGQELKPADYPATRICATEPHSTQGPRSLDHRADGALERQDPGLLYGDRRSAASMDPGVSVCRLSMLDRGVVYAIAHVRGGGEMGRLWYDNGKGLSKKNTFTDFIAVADELIA